MKISIHINAIVRDQESLMPGVVKALLRLYNEDNDITIVIPPEEKEIKQVSDLVDFDFLFEQAANHPHNADLIIDKRILGRFPGWFVALDIIHNNNEMI